MPRRVKLAVLTAFLLHGVLIMAGEYHLSYDAYNHIFFADHYLQHWWNLWEPRWYTGFEITSYPPLVHQLLALLGRLTGLDAAFGLLMWIILSAYPLAVYSFSRIFSGERAASYAAFGAALLPSLFLTAHTFGQLPTLFSALLALWGAAALADFLRRGDRLSGFLTVSLFATSMAGHHATLLFQPWLAGAVLLRSTYRQAGSRIRLLARFALISVLTGIAELAVIWPFWEWGLHQAMQTPIDHASRHNFFQDPLAIGIFFISMYGLLIPFIPLLLWQGRRRRFWGLALAFLGLFILGLGGTTPLPRLLFGTGWAWLTYDRFSFWASLALLPFWGLFAAAQLRKRQRRRRWTVYWGSLGLTGLVIGTIPFWLPTQPRPIDMQPIVDFLEQPDHAQYRYVTFGFGDQFAHLSILTDATTIDGSYHTARLLPELRSSGIAQIDTAYWIPGGLAALDSVLQKAGERGVRWGFVNLRAYEPVLARNGWVKWGVLSNGIVVWENPAAVLPPAVQPAAYTPFAVFSWGAFPLLALYASALLAVRRVWPSASLKALELVKMAEIALLPLGLTLWYYRPLFVVQQARIYSAYSDALFYLSDGIALAALLAWLVQKIPAPGDSGAPRSVQRLPNLIRSPDAWLFSICILATLSILWSIEKRTTIYVSLNLWLCFGLYWVLRNSRHAWRWFALGCISALVLQFAAAAWEFNSQSTAAFFALGIPGLGSLQPAMSGVSVVQLANGERWLRAYGTLPHPNLLGGFGLAMLAGPLAFLMREVKTQVLMVFVVNLGLVLIGLTFSRAAWLGVGILGLWLLVRRKNLDRESLVRIILTATATVVILFFFLRPLILTRLGYTQVQTEQVSNYTRLWLVRQTFDVIREHPLLGVGMGNYSLALSRQVADFYDIEPVHNLPLLMQSELGIGGLIALVGLAVVVVLLYSG